MRLVGLAAYIGGDSDRADLRGTVWCIMDERRRGLMLDYVTRPTANWPCLSR